MSLTKKQIKQHVSTGGTSCPYCNLDNINMYDQDIPSNQIIGKVSCDDCGKQWLDIYTLTSIEEVENEE